MNGCNMSDSQNNTETPNAVTNPIQACNDIFVRPSEVFKALSIKDNWSWFPFILVAVISCLPAYLYFSVVDYTWYVDAQLSVLAPNASPAELDMQRSYMGSAQSAQSSTLYLTPVMLILVSAISALYYTVVTRNDEKSIHSFMDWYGVQWWTMMPYIIGAVVSLAILVMTDAGSELSPAVMAPLSLSFVLGLDITNPWLSVMNEIRIDRIWGIVLGASCLQQWTNFSRNKAYIVAAIPSLVVIGFLSLLASMR